MKTERTAAFVGVVSDKIRLLQYIGLYEDNNNYVSYKMNISFRVLIIQVYVLKQNQNKGINCCNQRHAAEEIELDMRLHAMSSFVRYLLDKET